ncbi:MAG: hypothetical protein P8M78_14740 [Myxococcota bacterium]|nr:hypothetical protein [Myxococcota bacterium]
MQTHLLRTLGGRAGAMRVRLTYSGLSLTRRQEKTVGEEAQMKGFEAEGDEARFARSAKAI